MSDTNTLTLELKVSKQQAEQNLDSTVQKILEIKQAQQQLNTLVTAGAITQKDYTKATAENKISLQGLNQEQNTNIRILQSQSGSIKELGAVLSNNKQLYMSLTAEQRNNDAIGGKLLTTIQAQDKEYKNLNTSIGQSQGKVGSYSEALQPLLHGYEKVAGAFGVVGVAIGGAIGIVKSGEAIINSNMGLQDKWEQQTKGIGNAWTYLKNAISNLDFHNLISNIRNAYNEGVKYAEILDILEHRERGHSVATAVAAEKLAALKIIYQDVNKTIKERQAALQEAKNIETGLARQEADIKSKELNATKELILNTKHLNETELMGLITFKDGYEKKLEQAEEYNKKISEQRALNNLVNNNISVSQTGGYVKTYVNEKDKKQLEELNEEIKNTDDSTVKLGKVIQSLGSDQIELLAKQYIASKEANAAENENIATLDKRYNILEKKDEKATEKREALDEKYASDKLTIEQRIASETEAINKDTTEKTLDIWKAAELKKIDSSKYNTKQKKELELLIETEYSLKLAAKVKEGSDFVNSITETGEKTKLEKLKEYYEKELITDEQYLKAKEVLDKAEYQNFLKIEQKYLSDADKLSEKDKTKRKKTELQQWKTEQLQEINQLKISEDQKAKLRLALEKDTAAKSKQIAEDSLLEKQELQSKEVEGYVKIGSDIGNLMSIFGKKSKEAAIAGIIISKVSAIAQIIAQTAIANAKAVATFPITFGQPWVGINTASAIISGAAVAAEAANQIDEANNAKYEFGGRVRGNSHINGGVMVELEGDEGVIRKSAMTNPRIAQQAMQLNQGLPIQQLSEERVIQLATQVVKAIPVVVSERAISLKQREVSVKETKFAIKN